MDGPDVLVPMFIVIMIIAIVVGPAWLKSRDRRDMQASLRAAIERGQPLPPEVIEALSRDNIKPPATASRDLRKGVILLAVAAGIAGAFSYLGHQVDDEIPYGLAAFAAIPGAIGLAFVILSFFNKNKEIGRTGGQIMTQSLVDRHDVELAALAAAGGRREFGELVRRHGSAVRGLLRRMGAQPSLADDIAQDAFIQAFQRCSEFRAEGTFAAWVKRIAARLYIKRVAKEARYVAELETEDAAPAPDHAGLVDLDEALKALSEPERLCVSLCHGAGMAHPEIATALNLPLGTVKSHVKRGLDKLRTRLQPQAGQPLGSAQHVG